MLFSANVVDTTFKTHRMLIVQNNLSATMEQKDQSVINPQSWTVAVLRADAESYCRLLPLQSLANCVAVAKEYCLFVGPGDRRYWNKNVDPVAEFTVETASIISQVLLGQNFVFLSKRARPGELPDEGFMIDNVDFWRCHNPGQDLSVQLRYTSLVKAIHLRVHSGHRPCVSPCVVEPAILKEFECRLARPSTWQADVWKAAVGDIHPSEFTTFEYRVGDGFIKHFPNIFDDSAIQNFLLCHFFPHWQNDNLTLESRARDLAKAQGKRANMGKNSFRNLQVRAGCLNPSISLAKIIYSRLRTEAEKFLKMPDAHEHFTIPTSLFDRRDPFEPLLRIMYPEEFSRCLENPDNLLKSWEMVNRPQNQTVVYRETPSNTTSP